MKVMMNSIYKTNVRMSQNFHENKRRLKCVEREKSIQKRKRENIPTTIPSIYKGQFNKI